MAGDWIKMRGNLWDDPRVAKLCDMTDAGEAAVVGGLYWLWATADQHTEDGLMPGLTVRQIDRKTGVHGLGSALVAVGWIEETDDGVRIARFDEHNGKSAKRRCSEAQRKANSRSTSEQDTNLVGNVSACCADTTQTLEGHDADEIRRVAELEKRREEVIPPIPPRGAKTAAVGLKTWLDGVRGKGEKPVPEDDAVFAYAESVGIPLDFLRLAWLEFSHRYSQPDAKRYRDWRSVFRKAVRGNWLKLWWLDPSSNTYALTTAGVQAQRAHLEKAA